MQQWNCQARWVGRAATRRMELPAHKSHMVELAFALTFHKVQGATLECVILDFNFESKRECQFACMYVGITRVKTYDDWFVLPITSPKVLSWILDARADVNARAWQAAAAEAE
jgi:ATP-dependent exoDNAse (exonuclease V) alpha subunit